MATFDESKHKRDERGRFAEMSTEALKKQQTIELKDDAKIPALETAYGFADKERKNTKHHREHAKEMGFKNQDEYERAACKFFNSLQGKLYYDPRRKRFYRYNEKTRQMAVSSEGIIHTFVLYSNKKFLAVIKQEGLNEL